jgi:hypothetical protein
MRAIGQRGLTPSSLCVFEVKLSSDIVGNDVEGILTNQEDNKDTQCCKF